MRLYDYDASGNCFKVRLLLALLEVAYERVPVDIFAGDTLTDAYAALNPARETPVLELDDGRVVTQSNAILWFLGHGTDWLPGDRFGQARTVEWLTFEQEQVMGGIGGPRFRLLTGRVERGDAALQGRLAIGRGALDRLDGVLGAQPFLLGDAPTIADLSVYGYAHVAGDAGLDLAGWRAVAAWCERIASLPGYAGELAPYPPNTRPGAGRSIYD
ncbi:MAG: glutathione S-transferase family protein [Solirubrobacteraceae bacterium]